MKLPPYFFSCDWGTSSFRLRLVSLPNRTIECELREPVGVKTVAELPAGGLQAPADDRAAAFAEFVAARIVRLYEQARISDPSIPVVISGMASSSLGWREIPYAPLPFSLTGEDVQFERLFLPIKSIGTLPVFLISGVQSGTDAIRGEESELLGLFAFPGLAEISREVVVLLPGTHSKHVVVLDGQIRHFRTFMTGELLSVLSSQSVLSSSVDRSLWEPGGPPRPVSSEELEAFLAGIEASKEDALPHALFQVRMRQVLHRASLRCNGWFLCGLLQGSEVADLLARNSEGPILLAASQRFEPSYRITLETLGAGPRLIVAPADKIDFAPVLGHSLLLSELLEV